jgi:hypothetical protein
MTRGMFAILLGVNAGLMCLWGLAQLAAGHLEILIGLPLPIGLGYAARHYWQTR